MIISLSPDKHKLIQCTMEEDQSSGSEKQEATSDEKPQQGTTQQEGGTTTDAAVRSYECNFWKRGFTNAQALGGHMNIHRKDKAKLKQSSTSLDPPTSQPQHFPPSCPNFYPPPNMFQNQPGKWNFSSPKDIHTTDIHITNKSVTPHEVEKQILMLTDQNPLPPPPPEGLQELDLELRLGHNTDQPSSDTRKFF